MPSSGNKIRVLVVDDHKVVRVGLRSLLSSAPRISVVGEAWSVASAINEAARQKPDVVLMDIRLPDGSGVTACREIRHALPKVRVLFLTSFEDEEAMLDTMAAEAHGYLLKEVDEPRLIRAIEAVAGGQSILDQPLLKRLHAMRGAPSMQPGQKNEEELSVQERRVLKLVADGKTNKEIAGALHLRETTVRNYLSNIFTKLHFTRRSQAAVYYIEHLRPDNRP